MTSRPGGSVDAVASNPFAGEWNWRAGALAGFLAAVVAGAGIIMPIWFGILGGPTPESLPNVTRSLFGWHVLYGVVLGVVYPAVEHRLAPESPRSAEPAGRP